MIQLKNYTVTEKVSQSSRTQIFRGTTNNELKSVIIKLHNTEYPSQKDINNAHREYEIGKLLDFDGIIKYHSIEHWENNIVLIIEDYGAISLTELLAD